MNDRIRELVEQAGLQPYYDAQEGQIETLAESLIKECAGVAEVSMPINSHPDERLVVKNSVLKHFGVE